MTTSPRTRLRTAVVADLGQLNDAIKYLRGRWVGVRSRVYDPELRDNYGNVRIRPRRADEYPENKADEWRALAEWAEYIALKASEVATEARKEAAAMSRTESAR